MNDIQSYAVYLGMFCISCVACTDEQVGLDVSEEISVDKKAQLELATVLGLPENIDVIYSHAIKGSDQLTKLIMFMTDEGFINWIATYQLGLDHFDNEKRYLLGQNSGEWNPGSLETLATTQVNFENLCLSPEPVN